MATINTRLCALESVDDEITIINPRTWHLPENERAAAELENQRRIDAAVRAGEKIIYIQQHNSYSEG